MTYYAQKLVRCEFVKCADMQECGKVNIIWNIHEYVYEKNMMEKISKNISVSNKFAWSYYSIWYCWNSLVE